MPNRPRGAHAARRGSGSAYSPAHARRDVPALPDAPDAAAGEPAAPPRAAARRAAVVLAAAAAPLVCAGVAQALPVPTLGAPSDGGFSTGSQAAAMSQAAIDQASAALPRPAGSENGFAEPAPDFDVPVEMVQAVSPLTDGNLAGHAAQNLHDGTGAMVGRLTDQVPLQQVEPQPVQDAGGSAQPAPALPGTNTVGALSQNLSPQTRRLSGVLDAQTGSLVDNLQQGGVPTVGDVSGRVADSPLPGFGTVHGLTGSLPVTSMLGPNDMVTGALNNAGAL